MEGSMARRIVVPRSNSGKRLSTREWSRILRLYAGGKSAGEIARIFGIQCCSALEGLRRRGIEIRGAHKQKRLEAKQWAAAVLWYKKGLSAPKIALKLGCDKSSILAGLKRRHVRIRNSRKLKFLSKRDRSLLIRLYKSGWSLGRLSKRFKRWPGTISKSLHAHGIKTRYSKKHAALSKRQWALMVRMYRNGWSASRLAKRFARTVTNIVGALRRRGMRIRGSRKQKRLSKRAWSTLVRMYGNGWSGNSLAKKFKVTIQNVIGGLRRRGIIIRGASGHRRHLPHEWRTIRRMYGQGVSSREIGKTFGVPHSTIVRGLRSRGICIRRRHVPQITLSETTAAYMAGLFDGEGHVLIGLSKNKKSQGSHWVGIGITNTNIPVISFLERRLGGCVGCNKRGVLSIKPVRRWNASSRHAARILRLLLPYLRIKKTRAILALKLQSRIEKYGSGRMITANEFMIRENLRARIKKLNGRGIVIRHPEEEKKRREYLEMFKAQNERRA
jgi:hypothetical protein